MENQEHRDELRRQMDSTVEDITKLDKRIESMQGEIKAFRQTKKRQQKVVDSIGTILDTSPVADPE